MTDLLTYAEQFIADNRTQLHNLTPQLRFVYHYLEQWVPAYREAEPELRLQLIEMLLEEHDGQIR